MSNIFKKTDNIHRTFVIAILLYCIHTNSAAIFESYNNTVTGTPVPWTTVSVVPPRLKRHSELTCDLREPSKQCSSDCKTLLFCNGATLEGKVNCPPSKPDCDIVLNTCVTKRPDDQCPISQQTDSLCAGKEGYFPDPTNCQKYNYCEDGKVVQKYSCPAYYSFVLELEQCSRGAPCGNINCYGKTVALHSTYPYFYAFCNNGAIIPGSYSMCTQTTEEFDLNEFDCRTKCKTEGNIPHETECNKYYRCLATGPWGTLERTLQSCPPNQNFNKLTKLCDKTTVCKLATNLL